MNLDAPPNAIAIVGMACRFPGADTPQAFWQNLVNGVESIRRFSRDELLAAGLSPALIDHPAFVSAHGALEDIAAFDAEFFGYTPAEAALIDPQHRLLLECAWAALEDAGADPSALDRETDLTGIFAGCGLPAYLLRLVMPGVDADDPGAAYQAMLGNDKDFLASRIAYKLNLGGPAMTVQAACATSLFCVHAACQALLNGECDRALAGGVSLRVPQAGGHLYQPGGIHSADGHCRAFDAEADGTVGGSGAGVVVLKRLADAQAAGDPIRAVILGSAVNNDGARKQSFTAPGVDGQTAVIVEAQAVAGVAPESIGYVEAHGTGTALGDPIEIAALSQAFGAPRAGERCLIGSVKTNIGHLDTAAGIAGLIKTVLALEHGVVPPSLHYRRGNPNIDFARSRFQVCAAATPWPGTSAPRRAGVSSFGLGGANAHLVLEQAPPTAARPATAEPRLFVFCGRTPGARARLAERLAAHLEAAPDTNADDVAWTLASARATLPHAGCAVAHDVAELARTLGEGRWQAGERPTAPPRVAFLYPGQGAQQAGAGRHLYAAEPAFAEALDAAADALINAGAPDVRPYLLEAPSPEREAELRQTMHAQPALFALGYALTALWRQRGIAPAAVLGHSSGEYAAAVAAGFLSLPDAARALAARARLMAEMPPGGMTAIGLPEAELAPLLPAGLAIAAVNGPALCTVAGDLVALERFEAALAPRQILIRRLQTAHAFHTPAVDPVLDRFRSALAGVALQPPALLFYSAVLGARADAAQVTDRELWVGQIRQPVRFAPAVDALLADGCTALVEMGPGGTLATLAALSPLAGDAVIVPGPKQDERAELLAGLGRLWLAGATPDWEKLLRQPARRIPLPTYPFEATRHWLAPAASVAARAPTPIAGERPLRLLAPSWRRLAPASRGVALPGDCLLVADADELVGQLAERLQAAGARVATASAFEPGAAAERIVFVAPCHAGDSEVPAPLASLFGLARAVAQAEPPVREVTVVSRGAFDVTGNESLDPDQAALAAATRVFAAEFPEVRCRLIDIDPAESAERLAGAIIRELAQAPKEATVALRGGHRWTISAIDTLVGAPLQPDGVILITGGLGALGLAVAERLATVASVRLALVSRTAPAPGSLPRLAAMAQGGAAVRVFEADCADADRMATVVAEIRRDWGDIDGIIHAAGIAGGGSMALRSEADFAAVLRPKVAGARATLAALGSHAPAFVVFFSSINTLLPIPGQADYAAANAWLEAEAARLRRRGIAATAISWDAWRDIGMAVATDVPAAVRAARERELAAFGLATDEALDALLGLIGGDFAHVAVTRRALGEAPAPAVEADENAREPAAATEGTVIDTLAEIWKSLLGVAQVAPGDDFFRLGGHSLLATRVGFRVRQRWGCSLSIQEVFSHPTLAELARLVESRIGGDDEREVLVL